PCLEGGLVQNDQGRNLYMIVATPSFRGAKVDSVEASCLRNETVVVGPLEPGMWSLGVRSLMTQWTWKSPIEQLIETGQSHDVSVEVQLYPGTLSFLDAATGGPLSDTDVMIMCDENGGGCRTDSQGRVQLLYPPGHYKLYSFSQDDFNFDAN